MEIHLLLHFIYQNKKKNKDKILTLLLLIIVVKKYLKLKNTIIQIKKLRTNINLRNIKTKLKKNLIKWRKFYYNCKKNKNLQKNKKKNKKEHLIKFLEMQIIKSLNIHPNSINIKNKIKTKKLNLTDLFLED